MASHRMWSSDKLAEDDQLASWQLAANGVFGAMIVERDSDGPFRSGIVQTSVGALTLTLMRADPHRAIRNESMAATDGRGMVYINVPRSGLLSRHQVSSVVTLQHGWLGMWSSSEPLTVVADKEFRQLVIGVPAELVTPRLAAPAGIAESTGALCGLVSTTADYLFTQSSNLSHRDAHHAADHLADLIVTAFGSAQGSTPRQLLLQLAIDEAERRLSDRTLNAAVLAERVHVSRRTLENMFAERGTTVAR